MPVQEQTSNQALRMSFYRAANQAATAAVTEHSPLRGEEAEIVGRRVVIAVEKPLNAAYTARVLGTSQTESVAVGVGAVAMLALNLVVAGSVVRRGGAVSRAAAGAALVGHLGFFWYSQARQRQIRSAVSKGQP